MSDKERLDAYADLIGARRWVRMPAGEILGVMGYPGYSDDFAEKVIDRVVSDGDVTIENAIQTVEWLEGL